MFTMTRLNWIILSLGLSFVWCLNSATANHHSAATSSVTAVADHGRGEEKRCEEITVPMCRNIGYSFTSMPNQFHHDTQDEAGLEVHQFYPLVEIGCSEDLRFFICSLYTPICMEDYQGSVPSCKSVCERAKHGCEPVINTYGFNWPEHMNCTKFPVYGDPTRVCMDPLRTQMNSTHSNETQERSKSVHAKEPTRAKPRMRPQHTPTTHLTTESYGSAHPDNRGDQDHGKIIDHLDESKVMATPSGCRCDCREPYFIRIRGSELGYSESTFSNQALQVYPPSYFNHSRIETAGGLAPFCAASCTRGSYRFSDLERDSGLNWINITAITCLIICLLTFFTYLIDSQRFRYPERAIIFVAACFACVASGYLLQWRFGHSAIACDGPFIRYQRTGPTPAACVLSFILIYFFGMASAYWWLILTLTWFLAAGLKWGSEAITGYAQYFHLFAWLLPTAQSVVILCLGAIDGDSFVGICSVGNQSRANLLIFVITPLAVCIAIGLLFLIAGFVALFRIRRVIRQRQVIRVKADTLEKLMIKIGLSSFFYIVPELMVLACHIYEFYNRPSWEKSLTCICGPEHSPAFESNGPNFSMILLKHIMSLIIGITSGFWIWSGKTWDSWLQFYSKITCCRGSFGSPSSSRSGASQLLPNMAAYYGPHRTTMNVPLKTQTVNLNGLNGSVNSTSQHLLHHGQSPANHHHAHLHSHHGMELQSRSQNGQQLIHPLPSLPPSVPPPLPPPPPPLMMSSHHGGSLTGSQFTHLIGSINGNAGSNANAKVPLSHV